MSVTPGTNHGAACVMPIVNPPGMGSLFGPSIKVSENMPADLIGAECEVAVDPQTHHVVIAYNDFSMGGMFSKIGVAVSEDDGNTFGPPLQLPLPGSVNMNVAQSDPVPVADGRGHFYISWVGLDPGNQGPTNMNIWVARSSDGGRTFQFANASGSGNYDKPWLSASPMDGSLMVTWTDSDTDDIRMSVSSTGAHWSMPVSVNQPRQTFRNLAQVIAGANGRRYVAWFEIGPMMQMLGSPDNTIDLQRFDAEGSPIGMNLPVTGGSDSPAFEDPSVAVFGNNVYVGFISGDSTGAWDVRVATSTDGGSHFMPSVKVNDDPSCATHFHHQIVVDEMGNVHAVWYDNRYLKGNVFHAVSPPATAMSPLHFGASTFVNDTVFDFATRRDVPTWLGDYLGVTIVGSSIYAAWTDNRVTHQGQIFFARGSIP
jgi:hypothetical protein